MYRSVKRTIEKGLVYSGACRAYRRVTHRSVILAYHNVVPAGSGAVGDGSLHLDEGRFARQLDTLAATHDIVPLDHVLDAPRSRKSRASITFDDAYRGAVQLGIREIERRGLSATIFVSPGLLGDESLWWDALAKDGRLEPEVRRFVLEELDGDQERARHWASHSTEAPEWETLPPHARTATEDEVRSAAEIPGIHLQAHGWRHGNLASLEESAIREECERSARWITDNGGPPEPLLAYPYGRVSPRAEALARDIFSGALLVDGGTFHPDALTDRYRIPRINVDSNLSLNGFMLRTSGLLR